MGGLPSESELSNVPATGAARLRIPRRTFDEMQADLMRPHPFAYERVGFLEVSSGQGEDGETILLARDYRPIPDAHYLRDRRAGARIGNAAIRAGLQQILDSGHGLLHVHSHGGYGVPTFSPTDVAEQPRLIASFMSVGPSQEHGMLLLSDNAVNAWLWLPGAGGPIVPMLMSIVGYPLALSGRWHQRRLLPAGEERDDRRYVRQSFLGADAQKIFEDVRIGVVGLGGGGSHVVQQLGHIGVQNIRGFDEDVVEISNLNRLVGAGARDAADRTLKADVACRVLEFIRGTRTESMHVGRWESAFERIRSCDIVIGCVDSFAARRDLEATCRRWLIPYIDIGMDIHQVEGQAPRMGGQVILSIPGELCMHCMGFLTAERLAQEAAMYGGGDRPQVVWPNGVLASTAIGVAMELVTGWTRKKDRLVYLSYDGNEGTVTEHPRVPYLPRGTCPHYPLAEVGMPQLRRL